MEKVCGGRLLEWTERFLTTLKLARLSLQNKFRDEEVIQEDCFVVHIMENDEAMQLVTPSDICSMI